MWSFFFSLTNKATARFCLLCPCRSLFVCFTFAYFPHFPLLTSTYITMSCCSRSFLSFLTGLPLSESFLVFVFLLLFCLGFWCGSVYYVELYLQSSRATTVTEYHSSHRKMDVLDGCPKRAFYCYWTYTLRFSPGAIKVTYTRVCPGDT